MSPPETTNCQVAWPATVAIIPAYNEARFVGSVVLQALQQVDAAIVVDDGSTDDTAAIAEAAGARVVRHPQNMGKGAALNSGFREARKLRPEVVVLLDGDGQHCTGEIPTVVTPVRDGRADMVVGSRFLTPQQDVPTVRGLGLRAITWLSNLGSGVAVSDSQSGFRAFSRRALEAITFQATGFSVESEMQFLARQHGLRTLEVPITAQYPDGPRRNVASQGMSVLNGILRMIGQHRPLLFFGFTGLIVALAGMAWGYYVVVIYRRTQMLAVGYALTSVLMVIVGSVGLSTGIILHSLRGLLLELVRPREQ